MRKMFFIFFSVSIILLNIQFFSSRIDKITELREEYFCIAWLSFSLWSLSRKKTPLTSSLFEMIFLGFGAYVWLKELPAFPNNNTINLTFAIFIYLGLKNLLEDGSSHKRKRYFTITISSILLCLSFVLITAQISGRDLAQFITYNTSILAVFVASLCAFLIPIVFQKNVLLKSRSRFVLALILVLSIYSLLILKGRSGWLGLSMSFVIFLLVKTNCNSKLKVLIVFTSLILISMTLFYYKPLSSDGRILIYRISSNMFANNWLSGIGNGRFAAEYNYTQSRYFAACGVNSQEALLAGNTYYAFNDYWQVLIEHGILGISIITAFMFVLSRKIYRNSLILTSDDVCFGSILSLFTIIIAAGTTYAFHNLAIMFNAIVFLAIISSAITKIPRYAV